MVLSVEELHKKFIEQNRLTCENFVLNNPVYENMSVKEAKEHATLHLWMLGFARDYHQSMSYSEEEERRAKK
jgi:hypothetical protein